MAKIDNARFTADVAEIAKKQRAAIKSGDLPPIANDYIGQCILTICEGVSMRPNFRNYTWRDQMVSDGIRNCVRAIKNYDLETPTRSGKPNAHAYFSQIAYFAFLHRIKLEKREASVRRDVIQRSTTDMFVHAEDTDAAAAVQATLETLKSHSSHIDQEKERMKGDHYGWTPPVKKRVSKKNKPDESNPLCEFLNEDE